MPAARADATPSPARKISRLTESRDDWKHKYKLAKIRIRVLENQVRAVEASRESWKEKTVLRNLEKKT